MINRRNVWENGVFCILDTNDVLKVHLCSSHCSGSVLTRTVSLFLSLRCRSVPAAHHVPVPVSSRSSEVLRPSHALPRALHLLHQPIQCRHRGSQCDGCSCLHPLHDLPAPAIPRKPEPELALPDQLVPLPPVLRHRLRLLPVLHGSHRRHRRKRGRRAVTHPHADFLHGGGRSFGGWRRSRGPDRQQRRR